MGVAAALRREAELELRLLAVGNLRIQIGTVYACAVSVAALLDDIPLLRSCRYLRAQRHGAGLYRNPPPGCLPASDPDGRSSPPNRCKLLERSSLRLSASFDLDSPCRLLPSRASPHRMPAERGNR